MKHMTRTWDADPLTSAVAQRDLDILTTVRTALKTQNVRLAYQPIVQSSAPHRPAFYEGLLRVLDPSGRIIPAGDFIHSIEEREEGRMMDCLALRSGLAALAETPALRLSINMSARSIGYPGWEQALEEGLSSDPTVAERLIIEITESSALLSPDMVANFMERMHNLGISFALDDFGAGYTAFRHFKDFYFDIIKIDKLFVRDVSRDTDNQVLIEALVSIARQFEMFTVAEGVETAAEAAYLEKIGIDCLQGYLFAAPSLSKPWNNAAPKAVT